MNIFVQFAESFPGLMRLMTSSAFVAGLVLVALSAVRLHRDRLAMGHHAPLKTPITYFVIGILLLHLPETISSSLETAFGNDSLLSYTGGGELPDGSQELLETLIKFVQLIGYIAFIRGLMLFKQAGEPHGGRGDGVLARGFTHVAGGTLAINIVLSTRIIAETFGLEDVLDLILPA